MCYGTLEAEIVFLRTDAGDVRNSIVRMYYLIARQVSCVRVLISFLNWQELVVCKMNMGLGGPSGAERVELTTGMLPENLLPLAPAMGCERMTQRYIDELIH